MSHIFTPTLREMSTGRYVRVEIAANLCQNIHERFLYSHTEALSWHYYAVLGVDERCLWLSTCDGNGLVERGM